jgi:hypothetical protein
LLKKLADAAAVEEVQFGAGASDDAREAVFKQAAMDGAANHAPVSGDKYCLVLL